MQQSRNRLVGGLIILKVTLPFVIVTVALIGSTLVMIRFAEIITRQYETLSKQIVLARKQVAIVEKESQRLLAEARKIKDETIRFAQNVKTLLTPLKAALNGLSQALSLIARTVEGIINGIVSVINSIPFVNIPTVRIPNFFTIPAFDITLPNLNLQVSDEAYAAIRTISETSHAIAHETKATLTMITDVFWFALRLGLIVIGLLMLWLVLAVIGHVARCRHRLTKAWSMLKGNTVEDALTLL